MDTLRGNGVRHPIWNGPSMIGIHKGAEMKERQEVDKGVPRCACSYYGQHPSFKQDYKNLVSRHEEVMKGAKRSNSIRQDMKSCEDIPSCLLFRHVQCSFPPCSLHTRQGLPEGEEKAAGYERKKTKLIKQKYDWKEATDYCKLTRWNILLQQRKSWTTMLC